MHLGESWDLLLALSQNCRRRQTSLFNALFSLSGVLHLNGIFFGATGSLDEELLRDLYIA